MKPTNHQPHRPASSPGRLPHSVLPALILCAILHLAPVSAAVRAVTANPGPNASTQINIGWHTDLDQTSSTVVYTPRHDATWSSPQAAPGISRYSDVFDGMPSKTSDNRDWHEPARFLDYGASLTGLTPDTDYMYKIITPADAHLTTHTVRHFKTAGAAEFSFAWVSDVHTYTPIPARLRSLARVFDEAIRIQPSVDFVFSTGDMISWGGSYSFWKVLMDERFITDYLFADVIGNHDWMIRGGGGNSDFFRTAYNNPTNGYEGQEGVCYWFIYGDVLFLTFNNELMKTSDAELDRAQQWAASVINAQKGNYRRIILAQHYQWFDGRNGKSNWYHRWNRFCDEHNVTLALSGNNHVYQRTHTLRDDRVTSDGQGTVYMVAPSSDGERGVRAGTLTTNADKLAYTYSSQAESGNGMVKTIGCVLVDVGPDTIRTRLVYIDEHGQTHVADDHTINTAPSL